MKSEQTRSERIAKLLIYCLTQMAITLVVMVMFEYLPLNAGDGYAISTVATLLMVKVIFGIKGS